jgi:hypothetical protein
MASHLEPRPSDTEMTEAIRYHFPTHVQWAMLGTKLSTIEEALDLLKRVELMEWQQIMPLYRTQILVHQDIHKIIRTEIELKGKTDIYRATTPRTATIATTPDKIIITEEDMIFEVMKNHGILNTDTYLIEDKEEKVRGVDVESTTRKTKCRR